MTVCGARGAVSQKFWARNLWILTLIKMRFLEDLLVLAERCFYLFKLWRLHVIRLVLELEREADALLHLVILLYVLLQLFKMIINIFI